MRVKISYGVDIENVPAKIQELLEASCEKLEKSLRLIHRMSEDLDNCEETSSQVLDVIDKTRSVLSEADLTISDAQSILQGLDNYYNGEQHVPDGRPNMDTSGNATTQTEGPGEG
jgi:hypothetical protein